MKEKIFKILHNRDRMPGERFGDIEGKIEEFVNQEVEKRIAERMPKSKEEENNAFKLSGNKSLSSPYFTGFFDACKWLRSRLSQKTEGGGE